MKKIVLLFIYYICGTLNSNAQVGQWVWLHGDSATNNAGNFGTQGVSSPSNEPPAFYEPCEWADLNGNFWLFGGDDEINGTYGDLWKYDPLINQWTWMNGPGTSNHPAVVGTQGVPSPANYPASRFHAIDSWVDKTGNLWMFGGVTFGDGDLWKYDVSTNEWASMKSLSASEVYGTQGVPDPANSPSYQESENPATWTDNTGDLWFYSGGTRSNMWRYTISTNDWTWMKGPTTGSWSNFPIYGTMGVEDSSNSPGDGNFYAHWKDTSGKFWMFGGDGPTGIKNDMWRYNTTTNSWTWMKGDSTQKMGFYGTTKCFTASGNLPASRFENRALWTDDHGNFWMFGGCSAAAGYGGEDFNDLWKYDPAVNQWTWITGDSTVDAAGSWGKLGVSAPSNKPDGRMGAIGWYRSDSSGCHFYLFGGWSGANVDIHNDLWEYTPDSSCVTCGNIVVLSPVVSFQAGDTSVCEFDCINYIDLSTNATSWHWSFPGGIPSSSTDKNPQNICYLNSGRYNVTLIAANSVASDSLTFNNYMTVSSAPPTPVIMQVHDTLLYCSTNPVYSSYQWYDSTTLIPGATDTVLIITHSGNYNVRVTNENGCHIAVGINVTMGTNGIQSLAQTEQLSLYPNPAHDGQFTIFFSSSMRKATIKIFNTLGQEIYASFIDDHIGVNSNGRNEVDISLKTAQGIYFVQLNTGERQYGKKIIITANDH